MNPLTTLVKDQLFCLNHRGNHIGHPNLEVFLSQVEKLFEITKEPIRYSNLLQEEWWAIRTLADDRSIVIKKADKGSCIVVSDRADCLTEAEKQLSDKNMYQEVQFKKQMLSNLVDTSNNFFRGLKTKGFIAEKELKSFTYEYKKVILERGTYYLKSTRDFQMSLGDQLFQTAECLLKRYPIF